MKKRLLALLLVAIVALTGCQSAEEKEKAKLAEALENMGVEYEAAIMNVLSKEWKAEGSEEIYTFTKEATGDIAGDTFTYACGMDEENEIILQIVMDETKEERNYYVSTDDTGYGIYLDPAGTEEVIYLIQTNVELLEVTDERVKDIVGEWADKSDNRYIFDEDWTMLIKGSSGDTEGTYSVVVRDDSLILTLLFGSNTLEFAYEFLDDTTVKLCAPGTEVVHTWIKK